jgi:hypothetical protein
MDLLIMFIILYLSKKHLMNILILVWMIYLRSIGEEFNLDAWNLFQRYPKNAPRIKLAYNEWISID